MRATTVHELAIETWDLARALVLVGIVCVCRCVVPVATRIEISATRRAEAICARYQKDHP